MANQVIKGMGYSHMAIAAPDFDKSLAFYQALGLKVYTQWGEGKNRIALLDIGDGGKIELFAREASKPAPDGPFIHFAFSVQDVEGAYRAALAAGAVSKAAPVEMPLSASPVDITLRVAFVIGPGGEELEFFKQIVGVSDRFDSFGDFS